jgi:hypothetical protein
MLYKGGSLRLIICMCYSWEMTIIVLDVRFHNNTEQSRGNDGTRCYVTNDLTSRWTERELRQFI